MTLEKALPKYEYMLHTWGGFYSKQYKDIHGYEEGFIYFDTKAEREKYILSMLKQEKKLKAHSLVILRYEGYHTRITTMLHRVIKVDGKKYYTTNEMGPGYGHSASEFMIAWKWTPGFNDYPLGEDYDYSKVEIVQEWITGAFSIDEESNC